MKELRKLKRSRDRARTGRFLAEGEDLIAAAIAAGRPAVEGFRLAGTAIGGSDFEDVDAPVLASVSTLGSGTRAIGVYEQRWAEARGPLCVYLHGVSDPGNVGTVVRSALAFGASSVALGPGCADPHSPKAVRASMGAVFAVPLARVGDVVELPGTRVALVAHAGASLDHVVRVLADGTDPEAPGGAGSSAVTLLVGAEREGLPGEVVEECEHTAHIPIASESLNAAMAVTVALYETTRPSTRVRAS